MFADVSPRSPAELSRRADHLLRLLPEYQQERDRLHRRLVLANATVAQLDDVVRSARRVLAAPLPNYSLVRLNTWRAAAYADLVEARTEHTWASTACRTLPLLAALSRRDLLPFSFATSALAAFHAHVRTVAREHPDLRPLAAASGYLDAPTEQPEDIDTDPQFEDSHSQERTA